MWPQLVDDPGQDLSLDSLIWAVLGLYWHGTSLLILLSDERRVHLSEDQDALWRFFYRAGGMSRRIFKEVILKIGQMQVKEYAAGTNLSTEDDFYILYQGSVALFIQNAKGEEVQRTVCSGEMFDFKHLGMLGKSKYFRETTIRGCTQTKVKVFHFCRNDIERIANHPLSKGVWQSLLINNLSLVVAVSRGEDATHGKEDCDELFSPLQEWELPDKTLAGSGLTLRIPFQHICLSIKRSFHLPWPFGRSLPGMRQTQLPTPNHPTTEDTLE